MDLRTFFRRFFRVASIVSTILFIVLGISAFIIYKDLNEFNEGFEQEEKLFLLNDGNFIAGLEVIDFEDPRTIDYLSKEQLEIFYGLYQKGELGGIKGNSWKLFIVEASLLRSVEQIEISEGQYLTNEQAFRILRSNDPNLELYRILYGDVDESAIEKISEPELRSNIFILLFSSLLHSDQTMFTKGFKNSKIIIYPETAYFKLVNIIPEKHLDTVTKAMKKEGG